MSHFSTELPRRSTRIFIYDPHPSAAATERFLFTSEEDGNRCRRHPFVNTCIRAIYDMDKYILFSCTIDLCDSNFFKAAKDVKK